MDRSRNWRSWLPPLVVDKVLLAVVVGGMFFVAKHESADILSRRGAFYAERIDKLTALWSAVHKYGVDVSEAMSTRDWSAAATSIGALEHQFAASGIFLGEERVRSLHRSLIEPIAECIDLDGMPGAGEKQRFLTSMRRCLEILEEAVGADASSATRE